LHILAIYASIITEIGIIKKEHPGKSTAKLASPAVSLA
jgi:hypothetical protein